MGFYEGVEKNMLFNLTCLLGVSTKISLMKQFFLTNLCLLTSFSQHATWWYTGLFSGSGNL